MMLARSIRACHSSQRRYYFLKLIKRLLDKGVPLDAVGLESHLWVPGGYGRDPFMKFIRSIQDLGLDIYITELGCQRLRYAG